MRIASRTSLPRSRVSGVRKYSHVYFVNRQKTFSLSFQRFAESTALIRDYSHLFFSIPVLTHTSEHLAMFALPSLATCLASTATACACSCCTLATREALKSSARVGWSFLFTFSLLFSWVLRDFAKPLISNIPCKFYIYKI